MSLNNDENMAEHQLIGFAYSKKGYSVEQLVNEMGLTVDEWAKIKSKGETGLYDCLVGDIDGYFETNQ
jgi:hypothetical protein